MTDNAAHTFLATQQEIEASRRIHVGAEKLIAFGGKVFSGYFSMRIEIRSMMQNKTKTLLVFSN